MSTHLEEEEDTLDNHPPLLIEMSGIIVMTMMTSTNPHLGDVKPGKKLNKE